MVILPIILLERTGIVKDIKKKGKFFANIPPQMDAKGGSITISREIEQEKTRNFASSKMNKRYKQKTFKSFKSEDQNKQVVIVSKTIPLPIYILATYEITIRTNYQQEMNELVQPFISFPRAELIILFQSVNGNRYENFIDQNFKSKNTTSDLKENERIFETTISIECLGHIVDAGSNRDQPNVVLRENVVSVSVNKEYTWFEDPINPRFKKIF